jgi:hypothetical protein
MNLKTLFSLPFFLLLFSAAIHDRSTRRSSSVVKPARCRYSIPPFVKAREPGDFFVNQTYFISGAGSRRTTTFTLDGANKRRSVGQANGCGNDSARRHSGNGSHVECVLC